MKIDKKIETALGVAHFIGDVSDEELDYIVEEGLKVLILKGMIQITYLEENEKEFLSEDPDHGEHLH